MPFTPERPGYAHVTKLHNHENPWFKISHRYLIVVCVYSVGLCVYLTRKHVACVAYPCVYLPAPTI